MEICWIGCCFAEGLFLSPHWSYLGLPQDRAMSLPSGTGFSGSKGLFSPSDWASTGVRSSVSPPPQIGNPLSIFLSMCHNHGCSDEGWMSCREHLHPPHPQVSVANPLPHLRPHYAPKEHTVLSLCLPQWNTFLSTWCWTGSPGPAKGRKELASLGTARVFPP